MTINEINTDTREGKLLMAALAMLTTTEEVSYLGTVITGTITTPDEMLDFVNAVSEKIYKP